MTPAAQVDAPAVRRHPPLEAAAAGLREAACSRFVAAARRHWMALPPPRPRMCVLRVAPHCARTALHTLQRTYHRPDTHAPHSTTIHPHTPHDKGPIVLQGRIARSMCATSLAERKFAHVSTVGSSECTPIWADTCHSLMPPRVTVSCLHVSLSHASTCHSLMLPRVTLSCLHVEPMSPDLVLNCGVLVTITVRCRGRIVVSGNVKQN